LIIKNGELEGIHVGNEIDLDQIGTSDVRVPSRECFFHDMPASTRSISHGPRILDREQRGTRRHPDGSVRLIKRGVSINAWSAPLRADFRINQAAS
jgi:hypothetical protein